MNKIKAMPDLLALNENHRWKKCKDFSYTEKRRSDSQPLMGSKNFRSPVIQWLVISAGGLSV